MPDEVAKMLADMVSTETHAHLARVVEEFAEANRKQITEGMKGALKEFRETLYLEITGENYDDRKKVRSTIQFMITFKRYFTIVGIAVAGYAGKVGWGFFSDKGGG